MKTTVLLLLATVTTLLAQGPLTPPSVPAPTMKSLDQIEARTAIPKSPPVVIAGPHYTISQPGSYYLTGNIVVASGNGINITASNVTLDLNGFALISKTASPASGNAIDIAANLRSIEIKNGRITGGTVRTFTGPKPWNATFAGPGWQNGIQDVDASPAAGVLLSHLTVEQCGSSGIDLEGGLSVLFHIIALNNGGAGISAYQGSVTNATASGNGSDGIYADFCSVTNATAFSNGTYGIHAILGSVTNATVNSNGSVGISASEGSVTNATVYGNGDTGILAYRGSVTNATASGNGGAGIYASGGSVTNSRATANFTGGIYVGVGVASHCGASGNSLNPASVDKQIDVSTGGQRDACVPASE